jgi:endonuclease III
MINSELQAEITKELLAYGETVTNEELFPTLIPEAASLIHSDPYAFLIATCLDRGAKTEIIWTIPYYIKMELGHLDPTIINKMSLEELSEVINHLPKKPRYLKDAAKTIRDLTKKVVEEFNGDASKIWEGKRALEVNQELDSIHGVGEGIANMGVLLIEKAYPTKFPDKSFMNIKSDTHTMLVLYRLGASESKDVESAKRAARKMNPPFPGALDAALWEIGRRWCFASEPNCPDCPMNALCLKRM